ncbi:MAG: hypothetical protein ACKPKO_59200, partial [Candidatus Fonsibacter sp.]
HAFVHSNLVWPWTARSGVDISETGELILRAFVTVVHNVYSTLYSKYEAKLKLFAQAHKAETVDMTG